MAGSKWTLKLQASANKIHGEWKKTEEKNERPKLSTTNENQQRRWSNDSINEKKRTQNECKNNNNEKIKLFAANDSQ